jgi:hypothetical protein
VGGSVNVTGAYPTQTVTFTVERGPPGASGALSDGNYDDINVNGTGLNLTIRDNKVTYAKMQDISATKRVIGRNTAGAGDPEEVTVDQLLDWIGTAAQGDLIYRGATTHARLAAGTSGFYLKTQGAGANPVWADPFASPTFTGTVTVPTPGASDNSTKAASTAFVKAQGYVTDTAALAAGATIEGEKIGFRGAPLTNVNSTSDLALAALGKKVLLGGTTGTLTIQNNADIAYGTDYVAIGFSLASGNWTIARDTNVDLYKNGSSTSANVTVAPYGRFTLTYWGLSGGREKWTIDGTGLT